MGGVGEDTPELVTSDTDLPSGTTYHLSSRRLTKRDLRQIVIALGATVGNASAEDTRKIIEGKLREWHMEPAEI